MGNRIYLDTSLLLKAILEKSLPAQDARSTLRRVESHGYEVIIPQIVVGEAFSKVISRSERDEVSNNVQKLVDSIQNLTDPTTRIPPINEEIYELAVELKSVENQIDLCDALIISHVLCDGKAHCLLTTEPTVLDSFGIDSFSSKLVSSGRRTTKLEITDSI